MQLRSTWLMLALFAIGIIGVGLVGCGSDAEEESVEEPAETDAGVTISSEPVSEFAAEKVAIQEVYSTFYAAYNDGDIEAIQNTFDSSIMFGTIFGIWPVPLAVGWNSVKTDIETLWVGIGTRGNKWGQNDWLSEFWIRRSKGDVLEASAIGYNCFKGPFPGETHLYLQQDSEGAWKIHELDSITENNLGFFGFHEGEPRLKEVGSFFSDEVNRVP